MSTLSTRCGVVTAGLCATTPSDTQPVTVAISPGTATFTVTPTFYSDSSGVTPFAGTISDTLVSSLREDRARRDDERSDDEDDGELHVHRAVSGGFKGAVVTNNTINLVNSFSDLGYSANDGDVYVTVDPPQRLTDLGEPDDQGEPVRVGRLAHHSTGVHIYGNVWSKNALLINQPQVQVDGAATSSASSIDVSSGAVNGPERTAPPSRGPPGSPVGRSIHARGPRRRPASHTSCTTTPSTPTPTRTG